MDLNNKNTGKRKAQSIQDMINASPGSASGIRKSGYAGPKSAPKSTLKGNISSNISNTMDFSGINVTSSDSYDRWGNSNQGMPQPKKARYKSDVANPMRGNILKKEQEEKRRNAAIAERERTERDRMEKPVKSNRHDEPVKKKNNTNTKQPAKGLSMTSSYVAPAYPGSLDDFGWIIISGLLGVCVITTLIASGLKPRSGSINYQPGIITVSGVINTAYEGVMGYTSKNGTSSGSLINNNASDSYDLSGTGNESLISMPSNTKEIHTLGEGDLTSLGDDANPVSLDDGSGNLSGVTPATSHSELVLQLKDALSNGNYSIAAAKLCYADENTNELHGYPLSVVKLFCEYMAVNEDKLSKFISDISDEEYSTMNGSAYLVKLPLMKFTVKMGESTDTFVLDNTIVSVSGFSDQIVNGNQNAAIYPLLPCMYTVTLTNNAWPTPSQSQEIEATLGEGNLEIKVGL